MNDLVSKPEKSLQFIFIALGDLARLAKPADRI